MPLSDDPSRDPKSSILQDWIRLAYEPCPITSGCEHIASVREARGIPDENSGLYEKLISCYEANLRFFSHRSFRNFCKRVNRIDPHALQRLRSLCSEGPTPGEANEKRRELFLCTLDIFEKTKNGQYESNVRLVMRVPEIVHQVG